MVWRVLFQNLFKVPEMLRLTCSIWANGVYYLPSEAKRVFFVNLGKRSKWRTRFEGKIPSNFPPDQYWQLTVHILRTSSDVTFVDQIWRKPQKISPSHILAIIACLLRSGAFPKVLRTPKLIWFLPAACRQNYLVTFEELLVRRCQCNVHESLT